MTLIFYYTKTNQATRNDVYTPYSKDYIDSFYKHVDEKGRYALDNIAGPGGASKGNPEYEFLGVTRFWRYSRQRMQELYDQGLIVQTKPGTVPRFKRYLDENKGVPIQDLFDDILPLQSAGSERLGYPTQKPVALLERIISASSNEGDVVLDPFCGCGTTIAAAQKLNREWIGIDITHLSVGLMKLRLKDSFGMLPVGEKAATTKSSPPYEGGVAPASGDGVVLSETPESSRSSVDTNAENHPVGETPTPLLRKEGNLEYRVIGQPEDLAGAAELADKDKYGFQWWILPLIGARALGAEKGQKEGKKGSDKGIDGRMVFTDDNSGKAKHVIVSVKGGQNVNVSQIRDLVGTVEREKAAIGIYVTLAPPTKPMEKEAAEAGFYHSDGWNKDYPKIQILTVEDILNGKQPNVPPNLTTFKQAARSETKTKEQGTLEF